MEGAEEEAVLRALLSMAGEASSRSARATRQVPGRPPGGSAACRKEARDQGGGSTPPKQHSPFVPEYGRGHLVLCLCVWVMSLVPGE